MTCGRPVRALAPGWTLRRYRSAIANLAVALCCSGCASEPVDLTGTTAPPKERPALDRSYRPTGRAAAGDVFVQLFEWRWNDVAAECRSQLAPACYTAVQVSPPQEHAVIAGSPWWQLGGDGAFRFSL